jgi:hypothetical protein
MKLIGLAFMLASIACSWVAMVYGWGIQPESWPWIIGCSVAAIFLLGVGQAISDSDK